MNENIIKSDYFYSKCIWAIAFDKKPKETISYLFNFFGLDVFEMYWALDGFFAQNNDSNLDKDSKVNLGYLIKFLKDKSNGEYKFEHMEANLKELYDKTDEFILEQYKIRFMYDNAPKEIVEPNNKDQWLAFFKSMIVNDKDVLITHSPKCDRVVFETDKAVMHATQMLKYIGSVNMIVTEHPTILENELFLSRVNCVSNIMSGINMSDNTQKIYTKFRDRIK